MESQSTDRNGARPLHSCLVLGCGRSGTSMVTGALAGAGYQMAEGLHQARRANPKGFFEAPAINDLNELLLSRMLPANSRFGGGQRWLAVPPGNASIEPTADERAAMERLLSERPFCHKDPRFSFTLPAWREALGDTRFVCVFRDPARTVKSLVEECREAPYLADLEFTEADAFELWEASYRAALTESERGGEWLFLHYDQVLTPEGLDRLAEFLGADIDRDFPDRKLRRGEIAAEVPASCQELYRQLLEHAGHRGAPQFQIAEPRVTVAVVLGDTERAEWSDSAREWREQRGVRVNLCVLDRTTTGFSEIEGTRVLPQERDARPNWIQAARSSDAPFIAWHEIGSRPLPAHLRSATELLEQRPECVAAVADTLTEDEHGQFVGRTQLGEHDALPLRHWQGSVVVRREALAQLPSDTDAEVWLRAEFNAGRVAVTAEPSMTRTRFDGPPPNARGERPVVAAWPRWDDPGALDHLMGLAALLPGRTELRLRWSEDRDPPRSDALGALEAAYQRCVQDGRALEVTLEEQPSLFGAASGVPEEQRLDSPVHAILAMGDEPEEFLGRAAKRLESPLDVRRWWHQLGL
ncbi:MAG: sulfotransferase [Planctomycetota bacterium]|jgi:hypothetical protein